VSTNRKISTEERIELLEKDLKKVKEDLKTAQDKISKNLQNLESKLMDEVKGVETQMKKTEKKTKELQLKYLGRELVAVLWLISAAIINALPEFLI
jgi:DNA anti-recombination protein RmuC